MVSKRNEAEQEALGDARRLLLDGKTLIAHQRLLPFARNATDPQTLVLLARITQSQGLFDDALDLLVEAEAMAPSSPSVWKALADVYGHLRWPEQELAYRRKVINEGSGATASACLAFAEAFVRATAANSSAFDELLVCSRQMMTLPGATARDQCTFAQSMYQADALSGAARSMYRTARPCPDGWLDVQADWVSLQDWCRDAGAPIHYLDDRSLAARSPVVADLPDVAVFPGLQWLPVLGQGAALPTGFIMQRLKLQTEDAASPVLMSAPRRADLRLPASLPKIEKKVLLLGGMPQYYHHTIEFLGSLAIAEELGIGVNLPLVINDDLAPFQLEQLQLLGYSRDRLFTVRRDSPVLFQQAVVPSRLAEGAAYIDPLLPRWYRKRMLAAASGGSSPRGRKLYLSRRAADRRRVSNDDLVAAMLASQGFETVHPEALSVRQQIELFASATHIVGASGAALTNMIFAAPGAAVVALYNRHSLGAGAPLYFDQLATACGHRFVHLAVAPAEVRQGSRAADADIVVDLDALRAVLE